MKNLHKFLLLPIAILLVNGCSCSISNDNERRVLLEEARNLKFDDKYKDNLTNPLSDFDSNEITDKIYDNLFKKMSSVKYAAINNTVNYIDPLNHYTNIETTTIIDCYTANSLSDDARYKTISGNEENEETRTSNKTSKLDIFYNHSKESVIYHRLENNNNESISLYSLSGKTDKEKENYFINYTVFSGCLLELYDFQLEELYKVDDGYIFYLEYIDLNNEWHLGGIYDIDIIDNTYTQCIFELDEAYNIKKATVFHKLENDIGVNNVHTGVFKDVELKKAIYYFEYNERKNNNEELKKIEDKYSTPYFINEFATLSLLEINDDAPYYEEFSIIACPDSKTTHFEYIVWFDELSLNNIEFIVEATATPHSKLYNGEALDTITAHGPFDVKNHNERLSYNEETNKITYLMGSIDECLLFSIDIHLDENNKGVIQNGSVEIRTKDELIKSGYDLENN